MHREKSVIRHLFNPVSAGKKSTKNLDVWFSRSTMREILRLMLLDTEFNEGYLNILNIVCGNVMYFKCYTQFSSVQFPLVSIR